MAARRKSKKQAEGTAANVGYEAQLWQMADALAHLADGAAYPAVRPEVAAAPPTSAQVMK